LNITFGYSNQFQACCINLGCAIISITANNSCILYGAYKGFKIHCWQSYIIIVVIDGLGNFCCCSQTPIIIFCHNNKTGIGIGITIYGIIVIIGINIVDNSVFALSPNMVHSQISQNWLTIIGNVKTGIITFNMVSFKIRDGSYS